jgi:hypothetical protein
MIMGRERHGMEIIYIYPDDGESVCSDRIYYHTKNSKPE